MRKSDKPGTYRILNKGGTHTLSGVKVNGDRVKISDLSYSDAEAIAARLFPSIGAIPNMPLIAPEPFRASSSFDDDSFWSTSTAKPTPEATASLNASLGIKPGPTIPLPASVLTADEQDKKAKRAKNAKSLMELAGVGWAAGSVWVGRAACERFDKEMVNPNPRQVNDLADVTKETLSEYFGDRDIKPWMMMFLLTLGIPMSMLLQAKPKKPSKELAESPTLKSVPSST